MGIRAVFGKIKRILLPSPKIYAKLVSVINEKLLEDKTVFVTGGGSGIGQAIAEKVIQSGGKVIISGRREEKLKEVCEKLGNNCRYIVFDITKYNGDLTFFKELEKYFDTKITNIVNNAGIYVTRPFGDYTSEDFDKVISTNLKAPFLITQSYIKYCREEKLFGNIVFTASNRALFGDIGPYGISKAGLVNAMYGFARESIKYGIRVNAVAPGMTASEINNRDVNGDLYTSGSRNNRVITPGEIAEIVAFLLGDASKCVTGAIIPCDEGDFLR